MGCHADLKLPTTALQKKRPRSSYAPGKKLHVHVELLKAKTALQAFARVAIGHLKYLGPNVYNCKKT